MKAIHVLYISYDGMTDPLGQSQVIPYLRGLSSHGFVFHLISFEKPDRLKAGRNKIKNLLDSSGIHWYPCLYTKNPPVLSTIIDLRMMINKTRSIIAANDIKILHCRSYISALCGEKMSKRFNIPFLFDMRGFWADERVDGKIWNLSNPVFNLIYRFFKKKEKDFLHHAHHIVSLTHAAKREILNQYLSSADENKITVIPCCADLSHFNPSSLKNTDIENKRIQLNLNSNSEVLIYLGSLGTWYMGEDMIRLFSNLLKIKPEMIFLIVTKDDTSQISDYCKKHHVPIQNIRFVQAEREEIPTLIALSKISVFFILPSYSKKASSPTKLAELMSMGIPVLCNSGVGDVADIVNEYEAGWVLDDFSEESLQKISKLITQSPEANKTRLREAASEYGSLETGVKRYQQIYGSLLEFRHDDNCHRA
jgi:glycosyltransferase involved in cell wall biosynthesis